MKKLICVAWPIIVCLPCLLAITEGVNDTVTYWNAVGIAWLAFLVMGGMRVLVPRWMRLMLEKFVNL